MSNAQDQQPSEHHISGESNQISDNTKETSILSNSPTLSSCQHLLDIPCVRIFRALYENGQMLGLLCSDTARKPSTIPSWAVPSPLVPTALQTSKAHTPCIDRFPFPVMRDSMILFFDVDSPKEEEFMYDLFTSHSFSIKEGGASWDPCSWIASSSFMLKWGFLFFDGSNAS